MHGVHSIQYATRFWWAFGATSLKPTNYEQIRSLRMHNNQGSIQLQTLQSSLFDVLAVAASLFLSGCTLSAVLDCADVTTFNTDQGYLNLTRC